MSSIKWPGGGMTTATGTISEARRFEPDRRSNAQRKALSKVRTSNDFLGVVRFPVRPTTRLSPASKGAPNFAPARDEFLSARERRVPAQADRPTCETGCAGRMR